MAGVLIANMLGTWQPEKKFLALKRQILTKIKVINTIRVYDFTKRGEEGLVMRSIKKRAENLLEKLEHQEQEARQLLALANDHSARDYYQCYLNDVWVAQQHLRWFLGMDEKFTLGMARYVQES